MKSPSEHDTIHRTLLEFLVETPNRLAYEIACQLASNGHVEYNPVVFYGARKSGKSHILQAIKKEVERNFPEHSLLYLDGEEYYRLFTQSIQQGNYREFRESCRSCQCFFLDGFQSLCHKKRTQEELLFTLNQLQQQSSQIVFSSIMPLEPSGFSAALIDRLRNGLSVKLEPLSEGRILEYCRERAENYHVELEADLARALWEHFPGTFGDFKIMLHRLLQFFSAQRQSVTPSVLRNWVNSYHRHNSGPCGLEHVLAAVARRFEIPSPQSLLEKNASRSLVKARYVAVCLAREILHMKVPDLQARFGNRSESSIRNAIKEVENDPELASAVRELLGEFRPVGLQGRKEV